MVKEKNQGITYDEAKQRGGLTAREFARLFGISEISTYRLMETDQIESIRLGGRRLIPRHAFLPLIEGVQA